MAAERFPGLHRNNYKDGYNSEQFLAKKDLRKIADQMIQDAFGTIEAFMHKVDSLNGGLMDFIMQSAEDHPTEAAFAYMYREEFSKAKFWLEYAKTNKKLGRYLTALRLE